MSKPAVYNFELVRGDTFNEVWTFRDSAGAGVNLGAATLLFEIRTDSEATTAIVSHNPTGGTTGDITFDISTTVTIALNFTKLPYDMFIIYSDLTQETIIKGNVELYKRIAST